MLFLNKAHKCNDANFESVCIHMMPRPGNNSLDVAIKNARFSLVQNTKIGKVYQNDHKIYQMAKIYFKWPYNRPNGYKISVFIARPSKIGIFGLKTNHLATLVSILTMKVHVKFDLETYAWGEARKYDAVEKCELLPISASVRQYCAKFVFQDDFFAQN
jgi:hypothetical protein